MRAGTSRILGVVVGLSVWWGCSGEDPRSIPFAGDGEYESVNPDNVGRASTRAAPSDDTTVLPRIPALAAARPPVKGTVRVTPHAPAVHSLDWRGEFATQEGDRLYLLSQHAGLVVVDVSEPARPAIMGHQRIAGRGWAMHVRDGIVSVVADLRGLHYYNDEAAAWGAHDGNVLTVMDAREAGAIRELSRQDLPANYQASYARDKILYVVSGADTGVQLESIDLADPSAPSVLSSIELGPNGEVESTRLVPGEQHIYMVFDEWDRAAGSRIDVLEISGVEGARYKGTIQLGSTVQSSGDLSEHDGVLRVVSLEGESASTIALYELGSVETTDPERTVQPIGSLTLPGPAHVSVDGHRAFALVSTAGSQSIWSIDLSDPSAPQRLGSIEVPNGYNQLELSGDRLFAFAHETHYPESIWHWPSGFVKIGLFDVTNATEPRSLSSATFDSVISGGDMETYVDLEVSEQSGVATATFTGEYMTPPCFGSPCWRSGLQLFDVTRDTVRAGPVIWAPKPVVLGNTIVASDVGNLDVVSLSSGARSDWAVSAMDLVKRIDHVEKSTGERFVRVDERWRSRTRVDLKGIDGLTTTDAVDDIEVRAPDTRAGEFYGVTKASTTGTLLDLFYNEYEFRDFTLEDVAVRGTGRLVTVDMIDHSEPKVVADILLKFDVELDNLFAGVALGEPMARAGGGVAFLRRTYDVNEEGEPPRETEIKVVDLRTPSEPVIETVVIPRSYGATGLIRDGSVIATSHYRPIDETFAKARFYLDRFDLSNPRRPHRFPRVNIPGSLVFYEHETGKAMTVDYQIGERSLVQLLRLLQIDGDRATILESLELGSTERIETVVASDERVFVGVIGREQGRRSAWEQGRRSARVLTLPALGGSLEGGVIDVPLIRDSGAVALVANGRYVAIHTRSAGLTVIDGTDVTQPSVLGTFETMHDIKDIEAGKNAFVVALGPYGALTVPLPE